MPVFDFDIRRSKLGRAVSDYRIELIAAFVFSAVVSGLSLTSSLYMLQIFDRIMVNKSEITLVVLTLVMMFLFLMMTFADWSRSRLMARLGMRLEGGLNQRVFNASYLDHLKRHDVMAGRGLNDLSALRKFVGGGKLGTLMELPFVPLFLMVLFILHPVIGLLGLLAVAIMIGMAIYSYKAMIAPVANAGEAAEQVDAFIKSKLRNTEVIEAMGMLGDLRRRWAAGQARLHAVTHQGRDTVVRARALTKFVRQSQQSLMLGAAAVLVIHGDLSFGAIVAANMILGRAIQPLDRIASSWDDYVEVKKAYLRLESLLEMYPEQEEGTEAVEIKGHLTLEQVVATAAGRARPILENISFDLPPGQIVGILGPSGSGKSTLARTLLGIWPETTGRVLVDDVEIDTYNRNRLGPCLGYLPQDIELFSGSIADNIARFGPVDADKVIRSCKQAGVHEMILRFPQGYDTDIGEAGSLLSGGQKQRLGLARAIYGDPSIVVLDEPNSNLDEAGETALVTAIQNLKQQGKSVLLITHRKNILKEVDRILLLREGSIRFDGPPSELTRAALASA